MKLFEKSNIIILLLAAVLLFNFFDFGTEEPGTVTVIKTDTSFVKKIDQLQSEFSKLKKQQADTVFVRIYNNTIERIPGEKIKDLTEEEKEDILQLKEYKDTLKNKEIKIYSSILTDGFIYGNIIDYELNIPTITKTVETTIIKKQNGLYLIGEVGGGNGGFKNISVGIEYINKKNWLFLYRINLMDLKQPVHNIGVGKKLF